MITAQGPMGTFQLMNPYGKTFNAFIHRDNIRLCRVHSIAEAKQNWTLTLTIMIVLVMLILRGGCLQGENALVAKKEGVLWTSDISVIVRRIA
jgi:hypothetical protein